MPTPVVAPQVPTSPILDLSGKTAVITGGSKGIGAATVARFVRGGARVVTSGRSEPDSLPQGVDYVVADVATLDGVEQLARQAQEILGDIDIIVNNAGASTPHFGGVLEIEDAEWVKDLQINFLAAVRLNAALLPAMYARGKGAIVNVSSTVILSPPATMLHYAAAKAALTTYTAGLAGEAGPRGVRVNAVTPGNVASPGADAIRQALVAAIGNETPEAGGTPIPLGRTGEGADIAEAIAFLASDRAAWVTASNLVVDGGQVQAG
ncbi:SDR family oxidoreductase [Mycobacterium sp. ITM-2016-00317]|uniref:SDR family oxidoreductase n=1 Tax=Mycobacterium sp. ITM-2016-00317 TaxID=2099694 RepID=UPI00287F49C3|nr:SDR family oxidoreductase [Mycobacterium sp. ITM-2016-00317]WNG87643.1 SDR family oxidoreductase [Mycobacterium sp. ITM-2016-00317]